MNTYTELLLVAAITTYIVEVSGFTDAWRGALARLMRVSVRALRPLPPFDCGKCATFWACIIWALSQQDFCLGTVAFSALMSWASIVMSEVMIDIRMFLLEGTRKVMNLLTWQ